MCWNGSRNWACFVCSRWEARFLHLRVYWVIFETCLVLLCLFYFHKPQRSWQLCAHGPSGHRACPTVHVLTVCFAHTAPRGDFQPRHKHGSQTLRAEGACTKNCVPFLFSVTTPYAERLPLARGTQRCCITWRLTGAGAR